jgi:hypothetical protein
MGKRKSKIMKQFLALCVLLCLAISAQAAQVTLAWDASATPGVQYALFTKDGLTPYNYDAPIWSGSELTATVNVPDGRETAFVCRAWIEIIAIDGSKTILWSGNSNEEMYTPKKPEPPKSLIIRVLTALLRIISFGLFHG